jgi:hypothetical protein
LASIDKQGKDGMKERAKSLATVTIQLANDTAPLEIIRIAHNSYAKLELPRPTALVIGGERDGSEGQPAQPQEPQNLSPIPKSSRHHRHLIGEMFGWCFSAAVGERCVSVGSISGEEPGIKDHLRAS